MPASIICGRTALAMIRCPASFGCPSKEKYANDPLLILLHV